MFELREVPKIDEQANFEGCGMKVVLNLRAVFVGDLRDSFELNDDSVVADEIGEVLVI